MKFDFEQFVVDYAIPFKRGGEHRHVTHGWIGVDCPWCGTFGKYHLGFHVESGGMMCWRCGKRTLREYIERLFPDDAPVILRKYRRNVILTKPTERPAENVQWPPGTTELLYPHRQYLRQRGFNPVEIEMLYRVRGTTGISTPAWRWRLIVPIYMNGQLVAIQGRDITGKRRAKYRTMGNVSECIYNYDNVVHTPVIVEGVFDVWRVGIGRGLALFKSTASKTQLKLIAERWKRVVVMLDNDRAGIAGAKQLQSALTLLGVDVVVVTPPTDPADMTTEQIKKLIGGVL